MKHIPNFKNLKNILTCRGKKTVPPIELHIDMGFKERFMGRKMKNIEDEIEFSLMNNHDFILLSIGMLKPAQAISPGNENTEKQEKHWADEGNGIIKTI